MAPIIQKNVKYRIQNVDFGTFLERRNRTGFIMRPMKETSQQQWFFEENEADGTFQILNVNDKDYLLDAVNPRNLEFNISIKKKRDAHASHWKLAYGPSKELYIVSADVGDDNVLLLCESNFGSLQLEQDNNIMNITRIFKEDNYQWKILEVSPASLPDGDGKYRIRTLNGYAIHSEPGKTSLSIANQERGDHRAWEIISLGNGVCRIKNVQEDAFLVPEMFADGWTPVLSKTLQPREWDISSLGNMTYSIIVKRAIDDTGELRRLSLTLKGNTIILKPMKGAHNQLWYIEATDAPLDPPQPQPTPPSVDPPQPQPTPPTVPPTVPTVESTQTPKVIVGLVEGEYYLYTDDGRYLYVDPNDQNVFVNANNKSPFTVKLVKNAGPGPGSAEINLIHSVSKKHIMYSNVTGGYIVALSDYKMSWKLDAVQGAALKFKILDNSSPSWGLSTATSNVRPIYSSDRSTGYQNWNLQLAT